MRLKLISAALLILCACPGEDPVPAKDTPKSAPKEEASKPPPSLPLEPAAEKPIEGGVEPAVLPAKDAREAPQKADLPL